MSLRAALLLAVLVLGVAACAGDGDDDASGQPGTTTAATTTEAPSEPPVGEPGDAVEEFVRAVETQDQNLSWNLVHSDTKVSFQIDKRHWIEVLMPALRSELHAGGKVAFQKRIDDDHALVVTRSGPRNLPFPAALRGEDGSWRLELFYPEFNPTRPTPGEVVPVGKLPMTLDVVRRRDKDMELKLWLDGKELPVTVETKGNFLVTYGATLPVTPGKHLLVAYASTEEGFAGATAWEFVGR